MIVAVSSKGMDLNSEIDPRFGRCEYFLVIDSDSEQLIKSIKNENASAEGGAGTKSAQVLVRERVESVITGNIGPNAFSVLSAAKLKIYTGASGYFKDALIKFKAGELMETSASTVNGHH